MMPYRLSRNKLCVQKQNDDGKWHNLKCHDTEAEALAHLRALEVNVSERLTIEAVRQWVEEAGGSLDDFVERVRREWHRWYNDGVSWDNMAWPVDVFPDHLMIRYGEQTFRVDFVVNDEYIEFADPPWPVYELRYVPAAEGETAEMTEIEPEENRESVALTVSLTEAKKDEDQSGWYRDAVIVVEGMSKNGNEYTESALQSGIAIFEGARLVADHELEDVRPEGSVHEAIGKIENVYLGSEGDKRALRGDVFISRSEEKIRTKIDEKILSDLSIRAWGSGSRDESDNHFIVETFEQHPYTNVALVTVGAAGGKLVSESQKPIEETDEKTPVREVRHLVESEQAELNEALQENARLVEENARLVEENTKMFREQREQAADIQINQALAAAKLPQATIARIQDHIAPMREAFATHGNEQTMEEFRASVDAIIEAERLYLSKVAPNGQVTGLTAHQATPENTEALLRESFDGLVPDQTIDIAVRGRG